MTVPGFTNCKVKPMNGPNREKNDSRLGQYLFLVYLCTFMEIMV